MNEPLEPVTYQKTWLEHVKGRSKGFLYKARKPLWWLVYQRWHRMRKRYGLLPVASERRIVIGLGMHRTGTRSLSRYLRRLGLKDIHWPWWCKRQISEHIDDPERIVDVLEPLLYKYDCFADVPFPGLYRELDRRFPNSRFILVRRNAIDWWRSICKHWELEKGAHRLDPLEEVLYRQYEPSDMYLVTIDDEQLLISKFVKHSEEVQAFFNDRADKLLIVDLEDDRINEKISEFLDMAVQPYPHEISEDWP